MPHVLPQVDIVGVPYHVPPATPAGRHLALLPPARGYIRATKLLQCSRNYAGLLLRSSLYTVTNRKLAFSFPSSTVLTIHHIVTRLNRALSALCYGTHTSAELVPAWRSARVTPALQTPALEKISFFGAAENGVGKCEKSRKDSPAVCYEFPIRWQPRLNLSNLSNLSA